jgi:hemolysin D
VDVSYPRLTGEIARSAVLKSIDQTQMQIDDRLVNLAPGMTVTVEIKTGSRHIINYLLNSG